MTRSTKLTRSFFMSAAVLGGACLTLAPAGCDTSTPTEADAELLANQELDAMELEDRRGQRGRAGRARRRASRARPLSYVPCGGYASTVGARYVEASADRVLQEDEKIANFTELGFAGQPVIQKLADRTYFVHTRFYNTVVYVGDAGVLVIDPLGDGRAPAAIEGIESITSLPIQAIVYSHHHADHIGGAQAFIDAARAKGAEPRIIATQETVDILNREGSTLPAATEIIALNNGEVKFEGLTLRTDGFETPAHADDATVWYLVEEKIAHLPDLVNPDQMPFLGFAGVIQSRYAFYKQNVEELDQIDFRFFSGGHGNVGSHADLRWSAQYIDDLNAAVKVAVESVNFGDFFVSKFNNHAASAEAADRAQIDRAMSELRGKYGDFYGFEASVPHQIRIARGF